MNLEERNALVVAHLHMADRAAHKAHIRYQQWIGLDDLKQIAAIGLIKAANQYDPNKGTFYTFAFSFVRGAIIDFMRQNDTRSIKIRRIDTEQGTASHQFIQSNDEWLRDPKPSPEQVVAKQEQEKRVWVLVDGLKPLYRTVIRHYYSDENLTMSDVGERVRVNQSRVSVIHRLATAQLRESYALQKAV